MEKETPPPLRRFHHTAPLKFVILSILTFGLYELYWCYKCWKYVKEQEGRSDIKPFWRALFAPLWMYALFKAIYKGEQHALGVVVLITYFILNFCNRLPDPYGWLRIFTFIPMLAIVSEVNHLNSQPSETYWRFGWKHWVGSVTCALVWILAIYGTSITMPSKKTTTEYGFSVDLRNAEWTKWDTLNEDRPYAVFGTLGEPDTALCVVGARLPEDLQLSENSIIQGLFTLSEYEMADFELLKEGVNKDQNSYRIYGMKYDGYLFRFQIIRKQDRAYLIAAWSDNTSDAEGKRMVGDTDRVELLPSPLDVNVEFLGADRFLNHAGLEYYDESEYETAKLLFEKAYALAEDKPVYLSNAVASLVELEAYDRALKLLELNTVKVERDIGLLAKKAEVLDLLEQTEASYQIYLERAKIAPDDSEVVQDLLYYSINTELSAKVAEAIPKLTKIEDHDLQAQVLWAEIIEHNKSSEEAISYLDQIKVVSDETGLVPLKKIQILNRAEKYKKALKISEEMVEQGVRPLLFIQWKADCQWSLKWYADAKKTFEDSLKYDKDNEYSLDAIKQLEAKLGQGNNDWVSEPIDAVVIPAWAKAPTDNVLRLKEHGKKKDAVYQQYSQAIYFRAGEKQRTTFTHEVMPLTDKGLKSFSSFKFSFDPLYERIYVNQLEIINEQGEVVARGELDNYYVMDDTDSGMADTDKLLHIPVPALEIGLKLRLVVTKESLNPRKKISFRKFYFNRSYPTLWAAYYLDAPESAWKEITAGEIKSESQQDQHLWYIHEPAVLDFESYMPFYEDVYSYVYTGTSETTWDTIGEKYYRDTIIPQLKAGDSVRARLVDIISEEDSAYDKIQKISNDVQRSIRYKAIEFGERGIKPNSADKTLEFKYGDCKDHSLLIHVMLREAGVQSSLALVDTNDRIHREVPTLDQFNHMIVQAVVDGDAYYIDATNKFLNIWKMPPEHLLDRQVFVLGKTCSWDKIKPLSIEHERVKVDRRANVVEQNLNISEQLELKGYYAENFRSWINSIEEADRLNRLEKLMRSTGILVKLNKAEIVNEHDLNKPFIINIEYELANRVSRKEGTGFFSVPALWLRYYNELSFDKERTHPVEANYAFQYQGSLSVSGGKLEQQMQQLDANKIFSYSVTTKENKRLAAAQFRKERMPAEKYSSYRKNIDDFINLFEKTVSVKL